MQGTENTAALLGRVAMSLLFIDDAVVTEIIRGIVKRAPAPE